MVTKIDKLFALKAVEQKVSEERKAVEYECREELLDALATDGTDRRTSPYFGPEAGKYSIKRMKGKPASKQVEFHLADDEAFAEWLEANPNAAVSYAKLNAPDIGRWWLRNEGELPDGISMVEYEEPATPDTVTAQVYSFKSDVVIGKLADDGNFLEGANRLLLGDGE